MKYKNFASLDFQVSELGLGTWVTGGWLWGGSDRAESEKAIARAIECGVTLIDTAPVYGFGLSEEIVGSVIKDLRIRDRVILATKCGLEWNEKKNAVRRNSAPERIRREIDESRRRLQTDVIDIYQVHWPDLHTEFSRTMDVLTQLLHEGVIRAIGLSNFNIEQISACLKHGPVHSLQPPYNLYEREIEKEILPFCAERKIEVLSYGSLCRGLLTGKFKDYHEFKEGDIRRVDPKFQRENINQYLFANHELTKLAGAKNATLAELAVSWVLARKSVTSALIGARSAGQAAANFSKPVLSLNPEELAVIDEILDSTLTRHLSPAFMAPPTA